MKIVINACFGGFGLSPEAMKWIATRTGRECHFRKWSGKGVETVAVDWPKEPLGLFWNAVDADGKSIDDMDQDRASPLLVQCVEELGDVANGKCAKLKVVEIPDGIDWEIGEYDGNETVREKHRSWS